jgi:CRP-like cAMP-binding protein
MTMVIKPACVCDSGNGMPTPFLRKLEQLGGLSPEDRMAIRLAISHQKVVPAHQDIVCYGDKPKAVSVLVNGLACRYKIMPDGRRQIVSFQVPGDICDLPSLVLGRMDHNVGTLAKCTIALASHGALRELIDTHPRIRDALWRHSLADAAIQREWVSNIGRHSAYQRLAHLFCEIAFRLEPVGLKKADGYEFFATQADLGDALGLSVVHVNRVLQQLRSDGLITFSANTLAIRNWERLQDVAGFSPAYLQPDPSKSGEYGAQLPLRDHYRIERANGSRERGARARTIGPKPGP